LLAKLSFLILGLIAEKPLNPYEIKKLFDKLDMKAMFLVSSSSVYTTINRLRIKKYISGKKERQGNMPEKTVYSITKKGKQTFQKTLLTSLKDPEKFFSEFDIAITFVCHLNRKMALDSLKEHRLSIAQEVIKRKRQYKDYQEAGWLPYTGLIRRMHYVHKREAELKTIDKLIKNIKNDRVWEHYPVPILFEHALDKNK
jgi:DNA-binding PadR family transcriptional regulator